MDIAYPNKNLSVTPNKNLSVTHSFYVTMSNKVLFSPLTLEFHTTKVEAYNWKTIPNSIN